jgi:hypothetical protein
MGATERERWKNEPAGRENASKLPTESLLCIDECGSNIALTPLYTRAPKGERATRTLEALEEVIAQALLTITAKARAGMVPALRLPSHS